MEAGASLDMRLELFLEGCRQHVRHEFVAMNGDSLAVQVKHQAEAANDRELVPRRLQGCFQIDAAARLSRARLRLLRSRRHSPHEWILYPHHSTAYLYWWVLSPQF